MVTINIEYQGELRCSAIHEPSGSSVITDAPVDNHGKGASFSPTDLVATALGSCMATIIAISAEKHDFDLSGMSITVKKHMITSPERRIGKLETVIRIPQSGDEQLRLVLERAAHACPVHKSMHADMELPITFYWGT
ncbi:MAG: putative redox protein [Pseudohongiellaceae bacterium]|jgi:putative redox protein